MDDGPVVRAGLRVVVMVMFAVGGSTVMGGCAASSGATAAPSDVANALDRLHEAASKADGTRYFERFASGATFIGTDEAEQWDVEGFKRYANPYFKRGKGWTYHPVHRRIRLSGDGRTAWFYETLAHARYGRMRGSGVLVMQGGHWKIAQYVLSFAIPNHTATKVVRLIRQGEPKPANNP